MAPVEPSSTMGKIEMDLINARLKMTSEYSKFDVDYIHKVTDNINLEEKPLKEEITSAVNFYMHFYPVDLGLFIVNYEKRHPKLFEFLPELYQELIVHNARLEFKPEEKNSSHVTTIHAFYEQSGNNPAFSTFTSHLYKNETLPKDSLVNSFLVMLRKVDTWQEMRCCREAANMCPELSAHALSAISTTLAARKLYADNKHNIPFANGIARILRGYQDDYGLGSKLLKKTLAVIVFELCNFKFQKKWDPCLLSKRVFSCLNSLDLLYLEKLIVSLIEWDLSGLKNDQLLLDAVLLMLLGFLQSYSDKALVLSADTWLKIVECFYWSENVAVTDSFFEELCDFVSDPFNLPKNFPFEMPKKILSTHLNFESVGRPLLKDKYFVNFMDAWVSNVEHLIQKQLAGRQDHINEEIETCIKLFIMANLKAEETFSAIERIAQFLPLRKMVELFRWILNAEKIPNKLNEKFYCKLCLVAATNSELENFLDSCSIPEAESFYGFALWSNSRDTLFILNEKITKISCSRASNFREALASSENLKKLANDSSETDVFDELVDGKSLRLSSFKVSRNVGRHPASQKRAILLEEPVPAADLFESPWFKIGKRSRMY